MVLRLHGYGAWIESDGAPLEEYAVEVKDNVISCYVCSDEGKKFILRFDDDGTHCVENTTPFEYYGRVLTIDMDGLRVASHWGNFKTELISDGAQVGEAVQSYVFAPIDTTDDDDVGDDANNEHIGTIQAGLKRAVKLGPGTGFYGQGSGLSTGPIHERSKKAGSHRIALGESTYRPQNSVRVHYIDSTPWVTFRFLYRKRDMLKAQGIIPQSPSPSPPPNDAPGSSVKVEGSRNKGKGVKREREENGDGDVIEIVSDEDDIDSLQDELNRIQDRIARKRAKKPVKQEALSSVDDIIDLT